MSEINRDMLKYLNRFASPEIVNIELIKTLPSKIEFDYKRFNVEVLDSKLPNGRHRYTLQQKETVLKNIQTMLDAIHKLDYFSIARDVKKTKYRQYIRKYYTFKDENDKKLFETIQNTNILIVDDIVTSGTTISHLLTCLRSINDTNNIVIFSLIGKNI
jgi:predicted amidophosphoribosyltransferase